MKVQKHKKRGATPTEVLLQHPHVADPPATPSVIDLNGSEPMADYSVLLLEAVKGSLRIKNLVSKDFGHF
jgi:hypothetical protein